MLVHTQTVFDSDLTALSRLIAEMGDLVENQMDCIATAFAKGQFDLAQSAVATDAAVDRLCVAIEEKSVEIIARRQPMAVDLRETISSQHISHDLERIGHLAKNTGKRLMTIDAGQVQADALEGLEQMAKLVQRQLRGAMDSYQRSDAEAALKVWNADEQIDILYNTQFQHTLDYMAQDPHNVLTCTQLLFCMKNLERAGDHTTNIAETVHYVVTGHPPQGQRPKRDTTRFVMGLM
jgi:phosphate transport system protein